MTLPPDEPDWSAIILAAQAGKACAWRRIFLKCDDKLCSTVRNSLPPPLRQREHVRDASQFARVRLFRTLTKMRSRTLRSLEAWAVQAAKWAARDYQKYWSRQRRKPPVGEIPIDHAQQIPDRQQILALIARLPPELWGVVNLVGKWGLTVQEAAVTLAISQDEVRKRLTVALLVLGFDAGRDET